MRQSISFSYLFFLCSVGLLAQNTLSGVVTDGSTKEVIPFATVYFDGTTNGQTTDDDGRFTLSLEDIELPAVLVVSHVGYSSKTLNIEKVVEALNISLSIRGQIMNTITVKDENQRQKNIEEFRRLFLGTDSWGDNARIRNEEQLFFERDYVQKKVKTTSSYMKNMALGAKFKGMQWAPDKSYFIYEKAINLKASGIAPLVIEMPDLGYNLQLDLVSFQSEYDQGRTGHLGHYYFIPREGENRKVRPRHRRNRQRAYYNSSLHFLRSLFAGALAENGFKLLERIPAKGKKEESLEPFDITPYLHRINEEKMEVRNLAGRNFLILYYGDQQGRPLPESKWKRTQPIQSGLHIGPGPCPIRADGTVGDSDVLFSGDMGSHGIAWALPSDFDPLK